MSKVRPYRPEDRKMLEEICYSTGYMGKTAAVFWRHKRSFVELWMSYYLEEEPESTLVAYQANAVVGYLTGCVDSSRVAPFEKTLRPLILKHALPIRPGTAPFIWRGMIDGIRDRAQADDPFVDDRWPAHLHINLLPHARGTGLGRALVSAWLDRLRAIQSPGCHVSTVAENTRAVRFFRRSGFRTIGTPRPIAGIRGASGERLHQQLMVQAL